jgi:putative endonuclease
LPSLANESVCFREYGKQDFHRASVTIVTAWPNPYGYHALVFSGRSTQFVVRLLDRLAPEPALGEGAESSKRIGQQGEEDAYFYLRRLGYVMIARNYRSPRHHGEIDLIGWDHDVLCFIEVKTRTTHDVKPAEAAVDREKRRALRKVVGDYLQSLPRRQFPEPPPWRFDVLTVYYDPPSSRDRAKGRTKSTHEMLPTFELFRNAALSS